MKDFFLLVVEKGEVVGKRFGSVKFNPVLAFSLNEDILPYWNGLNLVYEPLDLVKGYCHNLQKAYEFYFSFSSFALRRECSVVDFYDFFAPSLSVAGRDAFELKTKRMVFARDEGDAESEVMAYFSVKEGIVQKLYSPYFSSFDDTNKHEIGHALDFAFFKKNYLQRSATMLEVMAIHLERRMGLKRNFLENTAHQRAVELLTGLDENPTFQGMSFSSQVEMLNPVLSHRVNGYPSVQVFFQKYLDDYQKRIENILDGFFNEMVVDLGCK